MQRCIHDAKQVKNKVLCKSFINQNQSCIFNLWNICKTRTTRLPLFLWCFLLVFLLKLLNQTHRFIHTSFPHTLLNISKPGTGTKQTRAYGRPWVWAHTRLSFCATNRGLHRGPRECSLHRSEAIGLLRAATQRIRSNRQKSHDFLSIRVLTAHLRFCPNATVWSRAKYCSSQRGQTTCSPRVKPKQSAGCQSGISGY